MRILDLLDIQTGQDLEGDYLVMVYDCDTYDFVEKMQEIAKNLKDKGYVLNDVFEYFLKIEESELHFQEDYIYCGCCGSYARHESYGVNDQYYIDECEVICKDCYEKDDYIDYLINSKGNCNVLMSDDDIKEQGYVILTNYEFKNDWYGEPQCDKKVLDTTLKGIDFFYYLNTVHPYGTYYTICVRREDLRKTLKVLKNSEFRKFHSRY